MKHAVHNIITPACRTNGYLERYVARTTQGSIVGACAGPATSFTDCYGTGTGEYPTEANQFRNRKQVYLAPLITKRKYEDMTSSRSDEVEPENDHEPSSKLSFFRENKRRKPPDAGKLVLMQVQVKVQDQGEDERQGSKRGSSPRSGSTSRVVITPDVCGESDLTAENLMAEESSRSSNNDGSSKFESAVESVSKGSIREPHDRPGSSLGVLHSFLDGPEGNREVSVPFIETSVPYQRPLARNDEHISSLNRHIGMEGVAKLEPASFGPLGLGSSSEPQTGIHSTSSPGNDKWLQLGVGPSRHTSGPPSSRSESALECRQESPPFQHGNVERPYGKRKTPSLDFQISGSRETDSFPKNPTMASPIQWPAQGGRLPHKFEPNIDSPSTLHVPVFVNVPKSSLPRTTGVPEIGPNYNLEKNLCLFGGIVTAPSPQLVLAPSVPSTTELPVTGPERNVDTMSSLLSRSIDSRHQGDPQGSKYPTGVENLLLGGMGKSGSFSRAGVPLFLPRPGDEGHFRSPPHTATDHSAQFQRATEDQRQAAAGHSWLVVSDSAQKLIPLANNFQGWTSDMSTSTREGIGSDQVASERHPNQVDLQLQRASSDEWGSVFRRYSPNMPFSSQVHLSDGSSRMYNLDKNTAAGSQDVHETMDAFKRAFKIQNRTQTQQWTTAEPTNLGSVATWCLNGGKPLPRSRTEKLENFGAERPVMSPMLQERLPVQGRYSDFEQILSTNQAPQRQSWQPAAGQSKQQQGNVNILRGSRAAAPSVSKPRFQALPPVSRGTSQAGLWFILQSAAENQNEEGGLPQISKAYLRIMDGKVPVSAVKKYLVSKLGLTSEAEVEITCRGQPVVPNLPLQHVRDVIWYSTLNPSKDQTTTSGSGDRDDSTSADQLQRVRPVANCNPAMFSKDVVMVLTYRRHPRTFPQQHC